MFTPGPDGHQSLDRKVHYCLVSAYVQAVPLPPLERRQAGLLAGNSGESALPSGHLLLHAYHPFVLLEPSNSSGIIRELPQVPQAHHFADTVGTHIHEIVPPRSHQEPAFLPV
jgi:hypothetical protein